MKLYESEALLRKLKRQGKTPEEMAEFCKCDRATIYRYLRKYKLIRSR